jgi:hypothetical protein
MISLCGGFDFGLLTGKLWVIADTVFFFYNNCQLRSQVVYRISEPVMSDQFSACLSSRTTLGLSCQRDLCNSSGLVHR